MYLKKKNGLKLWWDPLSTVPSTDRRFFICCLFFSISSCCIKHFCTILSMSESFLIKWTKYTYLTSFQNSDEKIMLNRNIRVCGLNMEPYFEIMNSTSVHVLKIMWEKCSEKAVLGKILGIRRSLIVLSSFSQNPLLISTVLSYSGWPFFQNSPLALWTVKEWYCTVLPGRGEA